MGCFINVQDGRRVFFFPKSKFTKSPEFQYRRELNTGQSKTEEHKRFRIRGNLFFLVQILVFLHAKSEVLQVLEHPLAISCPQTEAKFVRNILGTTIK